MEETGWTPVLKTGWRPIRPKWSPLEAKLSNAFKKDTFRAIWYTVPATNESILSLKKDKLLVILKEFKGFLPD